MILYFNFDGDQYEFELTYKQVRETITEIYCEEYDCQEDFKTIKSFIFNCDLEDALFDLYKDVLHDHFRDEAYAKYKDDCADDEYWKNTDIHGGV